LVDVVPICVVDLLCPAAVLFDFAGRGHLVLLEAKETRGQVLPCACSSSASRDTSRRDICRPETTADDDAHCAGNVARISLGVICPCGDEDVCNCGSRRHVASNPWSCGTRDLGTVVPVLCASSDTIAVSCTETDFVTSEGSVMRSLFVQRVSTRCLRLDLRHHASRDPHVPGAVNRSLPAGHKKEGACTTVFPLRPFFIQKGVYLWTILIVLARFVR